MFFDLHGTLADEETLTPYRLRPMPGAREAIRLCRAAFDLCVVVTNQAWVARGVVSLPEVERAIGELATAMHQWVDAHYICPHDDAQGCRSRKPEPGMLFDAARDLGIDLSRSWMVGDRDVDVRAGAAAGCRTGWIRSGCGAVGSFTADVTARSILEVTRQVVRGAT